MAQVAAIVGRRSRLRSCTLERRSGTDGEAGSRCRLENDALEEQVRQAQKLESLGRLAGGVAHDFNNLLTAMLNFTLLAQRTLAEPEKASEHLEQVTRAANRAAGLTKQLLAFARQQRLEMSVIDLAALLEEADPMLHQVAGGGIRLTWIIAPNVPAVRADPGQIERVLTNLVVNARDAMAGLGEIVVTLDAITIDALSAEAKRGVRPGEFVRLSVTDTGTGIAPELVARVFDPFFTTKTPDHGTGLGLSTSLGIVQQHDGFILVASERNKGAVVTMLLPVIEACAG